MPSNIQTNSWEQQKYEGKKTPKKKFMFRAEK